VISRQRHGRLAADLVVNLVSHEPTRLVVFASASDKLATPFASERARWLAAPDFVPPTSGQPWPLALFDAPCAFRGAALQALDAARLPWRIVYSTPSLSGLLAGVRAGLAISLRLAHHSQRGLHALGPRDGLPAVTSFRVALVTADPASPSARALCVALRADARGRRRR
jgi:DNA-binding transcriptional LysR family regulator